MLPHAEIGRNDHQEGAPHFINPFENLSKGFLEWELDRMHREAKKNALLAEAENEIMDVGDRNTQDGFCNNLIKYRFINSWSNKRWTGVLQTDKIKEHPKTFAKQIKKMIFLSNKGT